MSPTKVGKKMNSDHLTPNGNSETSRKQLWDSLAIFVFLFFPLLSLSSLYLEHEGAGKMLNRTTGWKRHSGDNKWHHQTDAGLIRFNPIVHQIFL